MAEAAGLRRSPVLAHAIKSLPHFDVNTMNAYLEDRSLRDTREKIYDHFLSHPELIPPEGECMSKEEHRALVKAQLHSLLDAGIRPLQLFTTDVKQYYCIAEALAHVDLSLTIKTGVQFTLWGGSVMNLGSERHRQKFFQDIDTFKAPGCFAMTELYHGSNVAGLQTEAILDVATDEWIVHTPDEGAIKWWIGNAACDGKFASVFARLKVPKMDGSGGLDDHGVHAIIVPLRDDAGNQLPGVEIKDCGYKVGLNGIDNGAIRFTHVRVPRENLLDRFASVDRSGRYSSSMQSASKRFAATLGELTGGRVGIVCTSTAVLKTALTIAIRYSAQRQQFGPPDSPEIAILDYQSQQQKLIPALATCFALHAVKTFLVDRYVEMQEVRRQDLVEDVHSLSAGLKAYASSFTASALNVCREACGGHGYSALNRIGQLRSDHDIFQTFEGDNTVLLQQVSAMLLKLYRSKFKGTPLQATYNYLRQLASDSLMVNPLVSHETDVRHLRDPGFQIRTLRYRTGRLLHTVASRLQKHRMRLGAFEAWNHCLNHLLALANAYVESVMLEKFVTMVSRVKDPDCHKALKALCDIFALTRIQNDILFRNDDYVAPSKAKAINRLIVDLCSELRYIAVPLVDSFMIPDHILRAPIGKSQASTEMYREYLTSMGFEL
eukprot:CAMPEP_0117673904 /NCGR_PEP_ID=MMETSP0804-20121206/14739_1 /TAXON_ID=1074897 /ORGANISM="Tetraselmis astigmatica, Strain CCMP880" /LENGTH=662 /DNA_ID=CAMNT_0005482709 /DNA_START=218 /DNA_END=2206 /DNA_ORIENTATION=+